MTRLCRVTKARRTWVIKVTRVTRMTRVTSLTKESRVT